MRRRRQILLAGRSRDREEPYAMVVAATHAEIVCSYCCMLCDNGTMYALSSASTVRYCSVKCITDDHPVHQLESPTVTALEEAGVQGPGWDAMRLVFRIASCRKLQQTTKSVGKEEHFPLNGRFEDKNFFLIRDISLTSISVFANIYFCIC